MINDEGCNLKGYFFVDALPGSFHIISGYYGNIVQSLVNERVLKVKIQHKINQISFGEFNKMKFGVILVNIFLNYLKV